MPARPNSRVFVSHSSADAGLAKSVKRALEATGFGVWLDSSDIRLGVLLRNELHEAIQKSGAVVLLWSKAAFQSRWVAAEILTAFLRHRSPASAARRPSFSARSSVYRSYPSPSSAS